MVIYVISQALEHADHVLETVKSQIAALEDNREGIFFTYSSLFLSLSLSLSSAYPYLITYRISHMGTSERCQVMNCNIL